MFRKGKRRANFSPELRSMYAAAAPFVVADDSADEVARLEVGSTIATSIWVAGVFYDRNIRMSCTGVPRV